MHGRHTPGAYREAVRLVPPSHVRSGGGLITAVGRMLAGATHLSTFGWRVAVGEFDYGWKFGAGTAASD
jgi:hypothetical protein